MKSGVAKGMPGGLCAVFEDDFRSLEALPRETDFLFLTAAGGGNYRVGLALSPEAILQAFRLRYQVFNLELGEGLRRSDAERADRDRFDPQMTHLVLVEEESGRVVGTYRLQTITHALRHRGIYAGREFFLEPLSPCFEKLVECGRACIATEHRSFHTIFLLWTGIAEFLKLHSHHFLFGCCSLTSTDPDDGWRALRTVRRKGYLHPNLMLSPRPACSCGEPPREDSVLGSLPLPKLFRVYMSLGARVISYPALDRQFGTVDFLVLMDTRRVQMSSLALIR